MKILGIIPARYTSNRFPGKALVDVAGKSMVQRVYLQASKAQTLNKVMVATDHEDIFQHVTDFGGSVCMTDSRHPSGTDRCYEALTQQSQEYDFVVNIQGDEPFIKPQQIEDLTSHLNPDIELATLVKIIDDPQQLSSPNLVKVVVNASGQAAYFSRTPIPYTRNEPVDRWLDHQKYYGHIGIYAYRRDILQKVTSLKIAPWELSEGLEQLRWLYHGYTISVFQTAYESMGIDTPEDLVQALRFHT